ncbi:PEP/pyruvate-binding domain-containing protein [Haloferax namakaokahaiae]|uniref:PEP/pyruvate-binding domain-containing protein n=1 Tax=Haloferax namakaokahaiae TaxID=1748331 RepID=A0ABD5ZAA0_9EURY
MAQFVLSLTETAAEAAERTGGKGANLARLVTADLPVRSGWCVTTDAYRALADDPEIQTALASLDELEPDDTEEVARQSAELRATFEAQSLPPTLREEITASVGDDQTTYAVRSSATAEDLPTASFAGQHETYLGVGKAELVERVRDCVASLFTERAVTYRLRNGISNAEVAMAVVIQEMVDADVAGVLFTADPVSGNRHVASVDANFGLGDTVVAGDVSPDNARIDRRTGEVLDYEIGEKQRVLRQVQGPHGGTDLVLLSAEDRASRALSDAQLRRLVALGERVETLLERPQDIEWALVEDEFVLLQARPITSLYPLPSPVPDDGRLHAYLSFGHVQAMPEALPPLVLDFWIGFMEGDADAFRQNEGDGQSEGDGQNEGDPRWAVEAGSRLYADLTPLLRIGTLRRVLPGRVASVSEPAADGLRELLEDRPDAFPERGRVADARTILGAVRRAPQDVRAAIGGFVRRGTKTFLAGPTDPKTERRWVENWGREFATTVREPATTSERVRVVFDDLDFSMVLVGPLARIGSQLIAAVVARRLLVRLVPDADADIDEIGKGFDTELVTQMNQRLGDIADLARASPGVRDALRNDASLAELESVAGGPEFTRALDDFLADFGHRGSGEIDLSRPRWNDDPATLLRTVRSNLERTESGTHRDHFERLERDAAAASTRLEARTGRGRLGPFKAALVRRLIRTYRGAIPFREYPKHGVAHLFAAIHETLADAGEELADAGILDSPTDVWYLRKDELLAALESGTAPTADIDARRRRHARHASLTPPALLTSEGETPMGASVADVPENTLTGTPVSAGVVEGVARVVRDPAGETLNPGEILVAPSTDPGWTPLFLNAAGLVMEVGGRMTHGALVAREYGIPAVAAVSGATASIHSGERIRIDGTRGTVELLDST